MFIENLLFPIDQFHLESVDVTSTSITIMARSIQGSACCPTCQAECSKVHSHYLRTVADLPWANRQLILRLRVRRFFCPSGTCPQRIFGERLRTGLPAYARRTTRLTAALRALAFATGGQAGARLAHLLTMPTSPRTLLRILHTAPLPPPAPPRVIGLDDWAWKKGRNYGTMCVDLERRVPIDLLPDREPASVATWLKAHPTIEVIARDRSGGYIEAATRGAPQAIQVADRWHLLKNLGDTLEYCFHHHAPVLKQAAHDLNTSIATGRPEQRPVPTLDGTTHRPRETAASQAWQTQAREIYERVQDLHAKQVDVATIARHVGVSRPTVYRYLQLKQPPEPATIHVARPHVIEPFKPYLVQRWNEGCRNALQMWRELRDQHGYTHAPRTVVRFVSELRNDSGLARSFRNVPAAPIYTLERERKRPLTALQATRLFRSHLDQRSDWLEAYRQRVCDLDPVLAEAYVFVQRFLTMLRQRNGEALDSWLTDVEASNVAELRTFASGLRRDDAAVKAGLTLPYSNGQTEAQIQRLKLLKRAMYGQADFELLRTRVLHRDAPLPVKRRCNDQVFLHAA